MSAREELVSTLTDLWLDRCGSQIERDSCRPDAEQLADAYAHELAEKQRDMLRQGFRMEPWASVVNSFGETEPLGTTHVIDHIDPEITEVRPARVALAELRDPEVS